MSSHPTVRLGEICRPRQWKTLSKKDLVADGFPVYGANGKIGFATEFTHSKPTLLIGCRGSCGSVHITEPFSYANGNAMALDELNEEWFKAKYLYHYFLHRGFQDVITGTSQPQIIQQHLRQVEIPLPPLEEQRRIAAILDKAENLRFLALLSSNTLASFKEAVFLDMFGSPTQSFGPWPVVPLGEAARLENGDRSANYPSGGDIKEDGIPFLSTKNIVNNKLDLSKTAFISPDKFNSLSQGKARTGDLVITLRGTLGSCCIFSCSHETAFINAQMMLIRPRETLMPVYLHALLTTSVFQSKLQSLGYGAAVRQLSSGQLSRLAIPVPPISTQLEFSRRLDRTLEAINSCNVRHEKINQMLHSMQVQAFCENRNV
jgi:type I restriction enzyme, S subunit